MSVEIVHVYRGAYIESIHRGDVVAVKDNQILFSYGDPYKNTYWRSSAKPFQVIPFIEAGGMEKYQITDMELALMCSSHGGEEKHVKTVKDIFKKLNVDTDLLDCGTARPMYGKEYARLLKEGIPFSPMNNPCSGKHSSMIGLGLIQNIDLDNYIDKDHEIQNIMLDVISEYSEMKKEDVHIAIDGCGVPVFGLPIYNMALAYSKLDKKHATLNRIKDAMTNYPYYVAGTSRLDTILMEETKGKILAKLGAESVYCMTVIDKGIGIAMKTEDGSYRALDAYVPELLYKYQFINQEELKRIKDRLNLQVLNHRKEIVGHYKVMLED